MRAVAAAQLACCMKLCRVSSLLRDAGCLIVLSAAGIILSGEAANAQDLSCPAGPTVEVHTGQFSAQGQVRTVVVDHRPCETFLVEVAVSVPKRWVSVTTRGYNLESPAREPAGARSVLCGWTYNQTPLACDKFNDEDAVWPNPISATGQPMLGGRGPGGRLQTVTLTCDQIRQRS
jgi:hypothetical protein